MLDSAQPREAVFSAIISLVEGRGAHARPTCQDILKAASKAFRVPVERLLSHERLLSPTRMAIYAVARDWTGKGPTHIGRYLNRGHDTILHGWAEVNKRPEKFRDLIVKVEAVLSERWPAAWDALVLERSTGFAPRAPQEIPMEG